MQAHFNVKRSRIFTVGTAVFIAAALLLSGCSASNQVKPFQMVFCGNPLDASKIESYGANLSSSMPQLTVENQAPVFTPILAGEGLTQEDQITGAAGQTKFTALIAAQEIDVAICTLDTAEIQARNESFMPLDQIFTAEELEQLGDRQLSFELTELKDGEEVPTGQNTPAGGVALTADDELAAIFGDQPIGVFVADNSPNAELAKEVMRQLAGF